MSDANVKLTSLAYLPIGGEASMARNGRKPYKSYCLRNVAFARVLRGRRRAALPRVVVVLFALAEVGMGKMGKVAVEALLV